ncbi:Transcriptional regulator [Seminavis robusta]|uniref:Transcriptional regulator n=1 Tax=Seminavis robusta TaxID=568900 RepID=A0A9N8E9R8_9STRA|nr:Transcriptional regulator [Seminavis robusta]|eukprot:Sro854_g211250.1 Transcriptional regulator (407) ;mRNA; f:31220-32639
MQNDNQEGVMSGIKYPGKHDVICGRGGHSTTHTGNVQFRLLVDQFKDEYLKSIKAERLQLATALVASWRNQTPPGRFLQRTDPSKGDESLWHDIGDAAATKKALNTLRQQIPTNEFLAAIRKKDAPAENPFVAAAKPAASRGDGNSQQRSNIPVCALHQADNYIQHQQYFDISQLAPYDIHASMLPFQAHLQQTQPWPLVASANPAASGGGESGQQNSNLPVCAGQGDVYIQDQQQQHPHACDLAQRDFHASTYERFQTNQQTQEGQMTYGSVQYNPNQPISFPQELATSRQWENEQSSMSAKLADEWFTSQQASSFRDLPVQYRQQHSPQPLQPPPPLPELPPIQEQQIEPLNLETIGAERTRIPTIGEQMPTAEQLTSDAFSDRGNLSPDSAGSELKGKKTRWG